MNIAQLIEEWIGLGLTFRVDLSNGSSLTIDGDDSEVNGDLLLTTSDGQGGTTAIPLASITYATYSVVDSLAEQEHHVPASVA